MHLSFHMGNHYNCLAPIAVAAEVVNVPQKEKHQNVGEVAEQASSTFKVNVNINEEMKEMKEKKKEDDIDIQEGEEEEKSGPTVPFPNQAESAIKSPPKRNLRGRREKVEKEPQSSSGLEK